MSLDCAFKPGLVTLATEVNDLDSSATSGSDALLVAVNWASALLTGSLGTSLAILAIAWVGFTMLWGRMQIRDGARIVLACFLLFGAPTIAHGLMLLASASVPNRLADRQLEPTTTINLPKRPPQFDPYAGASLPN